MDFTALLAALINTTVKFFLDLFLGGLYDFLSDLLFGGPSAGLI